MAQADFHKLIIHFFFCLPRKTNLLHLSFRTLFI